MPEHYSTSLATYPISPPVVHHCWQVIRGLSPQSFRNDAEPRLKRSQLPFPTSIDDNKSGANHNSLFLFSFAFKEEPHVTVVPSHFSRYKADRVVV